MTRDREERYRVLGMPVGPDPHAKQGEQQQHLPGSPVGAFGPVNRDFFRSLAHPVCSYKRWALHRRLGSNAPDEDDPEAKG
jgi:hypothetical protein